MIALRSCFSDFGNGFSIVYFPQAQLRKAIEDVNSGNMPVPSSTDVDDIESARTDGGGPDEILSEKQALAAQEKPLLSGNNNNNRNGHSSHSSATTSQQKQQQSAIDETITSIDSTLSNSDNCSDIELRFIDETPADPASKTSEPIQDNKTPDRK